MPQIDLGKLRFDWKGTWSNSATYELNDVVQYTDGATNVYVALGNVTAGTLPTDTNSWALMLAGVDLSNYDTSSEVDTKIAGLVDSAPETLDTLNELAAALGDDANFATTVTNDLASKLDTATYNTNAAPSTIYNVVNNGSIAYTIDGTDNPILSLMRGQKYVFDVNASGHPFHIQTADGAYDVNSLYTDGVTGQGTETGQVVIEVPLDAPSILYYVCQFHSGMQGQINVADLDDKAPLAQPLNAQSSAYTLQASDNGAVIKASGTTTITVPDAVFSAGERVDIINTGSDVITISAGTGVTLLSKESLVTLDAQYKAASIIFDTASQAFLIGDLA